MSAVFKKNQSIDSENKKNKRARKSSNKSSHTSYIGMVFRRYNPDKVTWDGVKNFFLFIFYKLGYEAENLAAAAAETVKFAFSKILAVFKSAFDRIWGFFDSLTDVIMDDLGEPIEKIGSAFSGLASIFKKTKSDKEHSTVKEMTRYVKEGFSNNRANVSRLISYVGPVLAAAVFRFVVYRGLNRNYGIEVDYNGEDLGTVSNYNVLENADKIIENKLVSTDNQVWNFDPDIKIVGVKEESTVDERRLANNILGASNRDIVSATGLYVNGEFAGAVEDDTLLRSALDSMTGRYENGDDNRSISFVQDVSLTDGIFFQDTIVSDESLAEKVTGEVSGEKRYTVVDGDSPWGIAQKNGITYNTLMSLNPGLGEDGLFPGESVLVGASVPFLQVKVVDRTTRQVEIPFQTKQEKNNSMDLGTTRVSQEGEVGINEETIDTTYIDGVLQSEDIVRTTVLKEPVDKVIQSGTLYHGQIIEEGTGVFIRPLSAYHWSRGFAGQYPAHNGVDLAYTYGTPIMAADGGVVTKAVYGSTGYGIYCVIEHGGLQTLYGHCSALYVSVGQQVSRGQVIARIGSTGNSTGPHLHFEIKSGEYRYNPENYIRFRG